MTTFTYFYLLGAAMILGALALVLLPMLRRGRQCGRPRGVFAVVLSTAFVVPLAAVAIYAVVGTPDAVLASTHTRHSTSGMTADQAIAELKQRLATSPQEVKGWLLLGRLYSSIKKPQHARDAYQHAMKLKPDNASIIVAWVEADSLARGDHLITGKARKQLQKAIDIDPHNQRGLWLLGISDYQAGHFVDAALTWRRLQALLKPNGSVADAVSRQIAMANARASGKSQAEAQALLKKPATDKHADARSPHIKVKVSLAPALKHGIDGKATLFVYAHAADGSPVPLAVKKLTASQWPTTVTLTDAMSMMPGHDLSSASKVTLTARISRSGNAKPQPGDLEGRSGPLSVDDHASADIVIDRTL